MTLTAFLVSIAYVPGWTGAFGLTAWAVLSFTLPWSLWRKAQMSSLHWAGLAFVAYAAASLAWAPSRDDGVWELWQLGIIGVAFYLGSSLATLRPILLGLALGLGVSSAVALAQHFGWTGVLSWDKPSGLFYSSVALGAISALAIVGLVCESLWWPIALVAPSLILSGSRGAWTALAFGLYPKLPRYLQLTLPLGLAAILAEMWFVQSDSLRWAIWRAAWDNLTLLGHGAGSFTNLFLSYGGNLFRPDYAHSEVLDLGFQFGVATIIPVWMTATLLYGTIHVREYPILLALVPLALFSFPLHIPLVATLAALVAGRLAREWDMAWSYSDSRGYDWLPSRGEGKSTNGGLGREAVPV